jgi:hypothetical protein
MKDFGLAASSELFSPADWVGPRSLNKCMRRLPQIPFKDIEVTNPDGDKHTIRVKSLEGIIQTWLSNPQITSKMVYGPTMAWDSDGHFCDGSELWTGQLWQSNPWLTCNEIVAEVCCASLFLCSKFSTGDPYFVLFVSSLRRMRFISWVSSCGFDAEIGFALLVSLVIISLLIPRSLFSRQLLLAF